MNDELSLYHHGVKGMRWGVRRKTAKAKAMARTAHVKDIDSARDQLRSYHKNDYLPKAKQKYQIEKYEIGKREAKKHLKAKRDKYNDTFKRAIQDKNRHEKWSRRSANMRLNGLGKIERIRDINLGL